MRTTQAWLDLDGDDGMCSVLLHGADVQICGRGGMRATMRQEVTMRLVWVLPILGAIGGTGVLTLVLIGANGAPQEAAGAAIACAAAIIPYVLARAVDALRGRGEEE